MTALTDRAVHHEEVAAMHLSAAVDGPDEGVRSGGMRPELVALAQAHATLALSLRTADQTSWLRGRWGQ